MLIEINWDIITKLVWAAIASSVTVEFIPKVKIKPWRWLASKIGESLNKSVTDELVGVKTEVKGIKEQVQTIQDAQELDKALTARTRILRFADDLYNGKDFSKEYYDNVLHDMTVYEGYCDSHKEFKNHQADNAMNYINAKYNNHLDNHSFLTPKQIMGGGDSN